MIKAIIRLQGCTTRQGRRAFVGKGHVRHGIAAGPIRFYEVVSPSWSQMRKAVAAYDTATGHTMGSSGISSKTVETFIACELVEGVGKSETRIRPLPLGTTSAQFQGGLQ